MDADDRLWFVTLVSRAAFAFSERQQITLGLRLEQEGDLRAAVRLRNHVCWVGDDHTEGADTFIGGFVLEACGPAVSGEDAVVRHGNRAMPYMQVLATLANASADEPEDLVAWAPPRDVDDEGAFVIQRHSHDRAPTTALRRISAPDVMAVLELLASHPREERLHRAMSHFRAALDHLDPLNRTLAAQSLWVSVENLTRAALDRLREEHGFEKSGAGKHQLAVALGFEPRSASDRGHLATLDRHVRVDVIFAGREDVYAGLRKLSDGFEHGYMDFGEIGRLAKEVTDDAFGLIRRAILREIGVPEGNAFLADKWDVPLGAWSPAFQVSGTYTDARPKPIPKLLPETVNEVWPDPLGLSVIPKIRRVVDRDKTRSIELHVAGDAHGLTEWQHADITETAWVAPGVPDLTTEQDEPEVRINGELVHDVLVTGLTEGDAIDVDEGSVD